MSVTRRQFCMISGSALAAWSLRADDGISATESSYLYRQTGRAFGTDVSIAALHEKKDVAIEAVKASFEEIELVASLMSLYRPESQICRLNRERELQHPHPYLVEVLRAAESMSKLTHGAFDITVQNLWQLFANARENQRLPDAELIAKARQTADWRRVLTTDARIQLLGDGTKVTLNGIAQGFAADRVAAVLQTRGVKDALVNTGELMAAGDKKGNPWSIGIQHPRKKEVLISVAKLSDHCLSTSGDYATPFSDDFEHHHIFDPATGASPTELASVSVVARTAMMADALSTAVLVLGARRGMELLRTMPDVEALLITKQGTLLATAKFPFAA